MLDFKALEQKWQQRWEEAKIFEANPSRRKKFFLTIPYPYVQVGPHLGNAFTWVRGDAYARFKRMQGFNVLLPQGFHATGEPILSFVRRLRENDSGIIHEFKLYGMTDSEMEEVKEKGAEFLARFWMQRWIEDLKRYGMSCDWRRSFITAITPQYNKFIEWQYSKLREKGFVVQGTHPVIWCPRCRSPTGDHDRLEGEGESPIEYCVLKFFLEDKILPCGTLRPETIFGVTNLWVNPEVEYLECEVGDEVWIVSEKAAEKLKDQLFEVRVRGKVEGKKLVGKFAVNQATGEKVLVLPAGFVDPNSATGVVMSVPSHAPYDWIALLELKEKASELEKEFALRSSLLQSIQPISIIRLEGFGEHPAEELIRKMQIKSQKETQKLDEATSFLYKKEFYEGVLKENCGKYAGKKVCEVKDELVQDLKTQDVLTVMWETTGKVVCRCKTLNHVKILENQWFLRFSDEEWKQRVRECIARMQFYPEEVKQQFLNTVEWLKDKACARKTGLGTKLPWDPEWIVETLSDSVIYMAYYTVAHLLEKIEAEKLTPKVFDFIFLGIGDLKLVSKESGIPAKLLEKMRREFEYFYPVDLRTSGKDLVQNHLTFYLFHHVAFWDEAKWPKALGVNGFVNVEGKKMSKRFGNIIPLRRLLQDWGADLTRINIISSSEGLEDANWTETTLKTFRARLEELYKLVKELPKATRKEKSLLDRCFLNAISDIVAKATASYERMRFKTALNEAFFRFYSELKKYVARCGGMESTNQQILRHALLTFSKLLAPIIPHLCEEFFELLGGNGFVSLQPWPKPRKVNDKLLKLASSLEDTLEDIRQVIKLSKKKNKLFLYFARKDELEFFEELKEWLRKKLGFAEAHFFLAKDRRKYDPLNKAQRAKPARPAIYVE